MKKKIGLFLGVEPFSGGAFQYNQTMLEALAALPEDKYSLVAAYPYAIWKSFTKENAIKSLHLPNGFWRFFFERFWRNVNMPISLWRKMCPWFYPLAQAIMAENCDLWVFPSQDTLIYQIPVPSLGVIHDLMHRYESQFPEVSAYGRYGRREKHYKNLCKYSKGILVDSEVGKQHVIESYGVDPAKIFPLPTVVPKYIYENNPPNDFDKHYNLPEKYIFYPAQFWEHKNHKRLIKAIARLKIQGVDIKLVLVGSKKNGYEPVVNLITQLNLSDNVILLGYVPDNDITEIYRRARALVMPTFFGPTNIPPLEAFILGCPVAVSNIYGMPEQTGDAALFFNPESVNEIADTCKKLWIDDDVCALLAQRGRKKAAEWGPKQFADRLKTIIKAVLAE